MAWFRKLISKFRGKEGRKSQLDPSIAPDSPHGHEAGTALPRSRPRVGLQEAEPASHAGHATRIGAGKCYEASQLASEGKDNAAIEEVADRIKAELVREDDNIHEVSLKIQKISVEDVPDKGRMRFKARGPGRGVKSDSTQAFTESADTNDGEDTLEDFAKYLSGERQDDDLDKILCADNSAGEENSGFERDNEVFEQTENYFSHNETESGYGSTSALPDLPQAAQARSPSEGLPVTCQASHHCMRQIGQVPRACEGNAWAPSFAITFPNTCRGAWGSHDPLENPLCSSGSSWDSDMPSDDWSSGDSLTPQAPQGTFEKIFFQKVEEKKSKDGGGGRKETPLITRTTTNNKTTITMELAELIKSSEPNHWYIYKLTKYCLDGNYVGYLLTETNDCSLLYFAMEKNTYPEITWFIAWALAKSWKMKDSGRLSSLEEERYGREGDTAFHLLARRHIPEKRCYLQVAQALWEIQDLKSAVAVPNNLGQLPHALSLFSDMRSLLEMYYNQVMSGALVFAGN